MNKDDLHNSFVESLMGKIPKKSKLAEFVAQTLCMEKETAYRRLRGDVYFTLEETGILAKKLNISLDALIRTTGSLIDKNEQMRLGLPVNYLTGIYTEKQILELVTTLENLTENEFSEIGGALAGIPYSLFLPYSLLVRFFRLKYVHHADNSGRSIPFGRIIELDVETRYRKRIITLFHQIAYTYYIWDRQIIPSLVDDIKYSNSIRLVTDEEVLQLKNELLRFLNDMEYLAAIGYYQDTGQKFELFISDAHIDTSYIYYRSENRHISTLSSFIFFAVSSEELIPYERISNWVKSLKRFSTLVSHIGERERILFFEEQRAIVNTLGI